MTLPPTPEEESDSPAKALLGLDLLGGWHVVEYLPKGADSTGGFFSQGYIVRHRDGREGFLKALDYSAALQIPDQVAALQALTAAYLFERSVLEQCAEARLSNVIRIYDAGQTTVKGFGQLSRVDYLIFERALWDARAHRDSLADVGLAWTLRSLHNVAKGLRQLHGRGIAHQDLKPSNVLVTDASTSKIGDLGRCSVTGQIAPHDGLLIAGAQGYAPPELLYGGVDCDEQIRRRACDVYLFGSMISFMFAGVSATAALSQELDPGYRWTEWSESYDAVLPYVRDAHDRVVARLEAATPQMFREDIAPIFRILTDPDPFLRGDVKQPMRTLRRYSLERFVSRLDLLARKAESVIGGSS